MSCLNFLFKDGTAILLGDTFPKTGHFAFVEGAVDGQPVGVFVPTPGNTLSLDALNVAMNAVGEQIRRMGKETK